VPRFLLFFLIGLSAIAAEKVEILRDEFGVPHIFARTAAGAAFGAGYAQAEDRPDALLRNLRSGEATAPVELSVRALLNAYCAGINRYFEEHPPTNAGKVTPEMVAAFSRRAFTYIRGSNDVLIAPQRTTSGDVIAILDPFSAWSGDGRPYEFRMYASEEALAVSGTAPAGVPLPLVGHTNFISIGWTGSSDQAGPRALDEVWALITARNLAAAKQALALNQIPGKAFIGTVDRDIFNSAGGNPDSGYLLRPRAVPQAEAMVRKLLADPSKWTPPRATDLAFSTDVYKAETWQARLVKLAPQSELARALTSWNRRSDAWSIPALGFYLFKMGLGQDAAALEPPANLSDDRIRSALRKAQDRMDLELAYHASYGDIFRVTRDGSLKSYPVGGGAAAQAGMVTPRALAFEQRGVVMMGVGGGQTATQIVVLSKPPVSMTVLVPGESDQLDSPHLEDQFRELFAKQQAKPAYFLDRKELEKHLSGKKELIF